MAALNKSGLEKNTLVMFQSDNGAASECRNGGLRSNKMAAWEGGIRVPLIASWPDQIGGDIERPGMEWPSDSISLPCGAGVLIRRWRRLPP